MSNLVTNESFSDDAMSIEYEDDDGAAAGDAAVGPHDDSNGSLDIFTRRSSKTSSTSSTAPPTTLGTKNRFGIIAVISILIGEVYK